MRPLRWWAGVLVALVGLGLTILPFVQVWQLGGKLLNELPPVDDVAAFNNRDPQAGGDFAVVSRTYREHTVAEVEAELVDAGFRQVTYEGEPAFSKQCCDGPETAIARVIEQEDGDVLVELGAADSNVKARRWTIFIVGLVLVLVGMGLRVPTALETKLRARSATEP